MENLTTEDKYLLLYFAIKNNPLEEIQKIISKLKDLGTFDVNYKETSSSSTSRYQSILDVAIETKRINVINYILSLDQIIVRHENYIKLQEIFAGKGTLSPVYKLVKLVRGNREFSSVERQQLLSILNDFFSNYYGLYFLYLTLKLIIKNKQLNILIHGAYLNVLLFDPEALFGLIEKIIVNDELIFSEKTNALKAVITTDLDYLGIASSSIEDINVLINNILDILNKDDLSSDQFVIFNSYFSTYYLQKNCIEKIKFGKMIYQSQGPIKFYHFQITMECKNKTEGVFDLNIQNDYERYINIDGFDSDGNLVFDDASYQTIESLGMLDTLIIDNIIIFEQLIKNPTPIQSENGKKRIFRFNLLVGFLLNGYINQRELHQNNHSKLILDLNLAMKNYQKLKDLWIKYAEKFGPEFYLFIKTTDEKIVKSSRPYELPSFKFLIGLLEEDRYNLKNELTYKNYVTVDELTKPVANEIAKYIKTVIKGSDLVPPTGETVTDALQIVSQYTGNFYHSMNSCLISYLYKNKSCETNLLYKCFVFDAFIRHMQKVNKRHIIQTDRIVLYRAENNISLGINGSYTRIQVGDSFVNPVFWSTSRNNVINLDGKKILLEISMSVDSPFLPIEGLSNVPSENEVIIPFGQVFKVRSYDFVRYNNQRYILIRLDYIRSLKFQNMPQFYTRFHQFNYTQLPRDPVFHLQMSNLSRIANKLPPVKV